MKPPSTQAAERIECHISVGIEATVSIGEEAEGKKADTETASAMHDKQPVGLQRPCVMYEAC